MFLFVGGRDGMKNSRWRGTAVTCGFEGGILARGSVCGLKPELHPRASKDFARFGGLFGEAAVFIHPTILPVVVSDHSMGFERLENLVGKRVKRIWK